MEIDEEELNEYEVINYFSNKYKDYWQKEMARSDWPGAKELVQLLGQVEGAEGSDKVTALYLLTDGESLISYCALSRENSTVLEDIGGSSMWISYMYTSPSYRNNGCMKKLLQTAEENARNLDAKYLYFATALEDRDTAFDYSFVKTVNTADGKQLKLFSKKIKKGLFW